MSDWKINKEQSNYLSAKLIEALENDPAHLKQQLKTAKEEIQAYKEDRFCQGGCAVYQYDKIKELKEENEKVRNILRQDYCLEYQPMFNESPPFETRFKQVFKFKGKTFEEWDNLTQQNKQMREVLEFYAETENYQDDADDFGFNYRPASIYGDNGKLARQTLTKLEKR